MRVLDHVESLLLQHFEVWLWLAVIEEESCHLLVAIDARKAVTFLLLTDLESEAFKGKEGLVGCVTVEDFEVVIIVVVHREHGGGIQ